VAPKDVFGKLVKLAMRRIVQEILENKVSDFTGRDYYKHTAEARGHRNGYEHSTLRTSEGHLDILRPQVRNTAVPFESQAWPHLKKMSFSQKGQHSEQGHSAILYRESGLKLIYAVLIRVARRWNALKFTFDEQAKILALRHDLKHDAVKERTITKTNRKPYATN
jgi:hypothetical protein